VLTILPAILMLPGAIPLGVALWANRRTSLAHALIWALIAWLTWVAAALWTDIDSLRYSALALTGCAGVAVFGARRPHVAAWNSVVAGLFAVMMWPVVEIEIIGVQSFEGLRVWFLIGTIGVGVINYFPTRLAPAALLLELACGCHIAISLKSDDLPAAARPIVDASLAAVPWIAWICLCRTDRTASELDRIWLSFRDHWGLVWGQRVREQFNNAAGNAGWPVKLLWRGLTWEKETPASEPAEQAKMVETLRAILQRFL
jgi:hypothetical protein